MELLKNVSLAEFTTFKIGGKADYFCVARSVAELQEAFAFARSCSLPLFILGGGSNVLMRDDGFRGLVVKIEIKNSPLEGSTPPVGGGRDVCIVVGAGESWDALVAETVAHGLWGVENLSGIPGTVGAAPIQNIGAYGSEVKEVIEWVEVLDKNTSAVRRFSRDECEFGYRDSIFKKPEGRDYIVTSVAFRLRKNGAPNLSYKDLAEYFAEKPDPSLVDIRRAVLEIRGRKFPDLKTHGTAGSFFKNPIISQEKFDELKKKYPEFVGYQQPTTNNQPPTIKVSLAWILDKICGLNGYKIDKVALWKNQPIVLVSQDGAGAKEISAFADDIARIVKEKTGIEIEREVQNIC
ncbi:MAG: UDP-N-acetylenolpyruvoylglucosamine reductase [Candidatus Taylorbacteria bacterium RIFCSPHIGHO2_02_FULL_47_18]|uniref:UDP-N-acetylenolpyruvoylglucosamine reductase n=1 Tax=Candidatus Taylorbacteria bacterium RIFCSPLOWO2_01_FULL_48_100 TaxID=1802322 RepID=A0A1G2NFG8_9BACT|nr:MAG: UDP-N-acetylenolpyruvoylglucosamine reductase [Candidatus Taylorbacteria bacterium RIFCSPHIGHO2_02_FULL_47_18]OHA34806.1 MAG: UDP-N-acetylenolpyruvoylglucosamine reductase [Candidatus Taylorbacteria bacterium RIFCSPLOWO2_01_FULL_48_100]OHA41112.1 MAG: UDP-N-acetylenolpyruvoylglucosamine reductase [Candidatus Taylorbacteria bacterium RIFCSPLOWO2_02_FULL_48_16]OHA45709.1 MAG: UDP-N-acetylenolpyruvoylglucosamine reductase [Candidatus Taylorbacteria bacterium RIFCSPLOWO2_12_FULL_48_11]